MGNCISGTNDGTIQMLDGANPEKSLNKIESRRLYSFGDKRQTVPDIPNTINGIKNLYNINGTGFIILDSTDQIWVIGANDAGQLGMGEIEKIPDWTLNTYFSELDMTIAKIATSSNGQVVLWMTKDKKIYESGSYNGGLPLTTPLNVDSSWLKTHGWQSGIDIQCAQMLF